MIIYKITNKINGKIYIGQTTGSIMTRWYAHQSNKHCSAIHSAFKKHGKENFTIEEIDGANSLSELNYLEQHHIYMNNSMAPNGYNLKLGGMNHRLTEKAKNNLSKINKGNQYAKGKPRSEEVKNRISEKLKGIPKSEETIVKFIERANSKKAKEHASTLCEYRKIKVIATNIKTKESILFNSISDAARYIGSYAGNINKVLKGINKQARGWTFEKESE